MHVRDGSLRRTVHGRVVASFFVGTEESPIRVSAFLTFWLMARGGTLFAKYIPSFDQGLKKQISGTT
jgi:hypothetical protein